MATYSITVSSKGQVTLPAELRRRWQIGTGSRLEFVVDAAGEVLIRPLTPSPVIWDEAAGPRKPLMADDDAVAGQAIDRDRRSKSAKAAA